MSHVDDELAEFEREIEELAQSGSPTVAEGNAEIATAPAESAIPCVVPPQLFISNAHAYAPPQLNSPTAAVAAEPNKPAYQPYVRSNGVVQPPLPQGPGPASSSAAGAPAPISHAPRLPERAQPAPMPTADDMHKKITRVAAGKYWQDPSMADWPDNDYRCFVGNLGNEVDDNSLIRAFQSYPSFQRAKVIFDKRLRKTRGYGFVSFRNAECFSKALREMQGKYIGNRPITIRRSEYQERSLGAGSKRHRD